MVRVLMNFHENGGHTDRYVTAGDLPPPHPEYVEADPRLLPLFAAMEGSFAWTRGTLSSTPWLAWSISFSTRSSTA